jgi:two-component system sensor histidine kinase ArlS
VLEESLAVCTSETARLRKLVLELLELTRTESISHSEAKPIPIMETIEQVIKNFSVLYPDFSITFDDKSSGNLQVLITKHHLEQILLILLDNAVKYSLEQKRIELSGYADESHVFIEIKDQGMGISEEELGKIFHRFYRVDKARSREKGGTGLGLSIAKRLVAKYEGIITVKSKESSGTAFKIQFPFIK